MLKLRAMMCRKLLVMVSLLSCAAAWADAWSELSDAEKKRVEKGEMITRTIDVAHSAWPRFKVYHLMKATPEEAAAVFWDFEDQKNFVPDLLESKISKVHSPRTVEVFYVAKIPVFSDEQYTAKNTLSAANGAYQTEWTLVSSINASAIDGSVRFEPHGAQTLMAYDTLVVPKNPTLAKFAKGQAVKKTFKTIEAIIAHIEKAHANQPARLGKAVENLRKALAN